MSYDYQTERASIFTEEGTQTLLKIRDNVSKLLNIAGAFRHAEATKGVGGDTFLQCACIDYLVELGEIVCLRSDCWAQYEVFSTPQISN